MKKQKFPSWVVKSNKRKKLRHARRTVWKQEYPRRLNTGRWKDIRREKQAWVIMVSVETELRVNSDGWNAGSAVGHPVLPDMKHLQLTLLWFHFTTGASSLCMCQLCPCRGGGAKRQCPKYQAGVQSMGSSSQMVFSRWAQDATMAFLSSSEAISGAKLICGARTLNPQKCSAPCCDPGESRELIRSCILYVSFQ